MSELDPRLLSVVMPVRDGADHVAAALESVLGQELPGGVGMEVVVVDDGSVDETPQILGTYAADPRVRVVRGTATGLVDALNLGVRHTRGAVIARMDADDVALPGRLAAQWRLLADSPEIVFERACRWAPRSPVFVMVTDSSSSFTAAVVSRA